MEPPDLDALEKIQDKLNKKLASWEKKKLQELLKSFRDAETEKKARLATVDGWQKTRLESLLAEVDRIMNKLDQAAEMWVKGRNDVTPDSQHASLALYPALQGNQAALNTMAITINMAHMLHMPVLSYMQDYQLSLISRVTNDLRLQIKEQLKLGYIQGESIPQIAKRLRNTKLDKGVWPSVSKRAQVIARTEILRASNQGALAVYQQYGVKRVMWLAAADERTCPICGALHRKLFPIEQIPFGAPPAHPRCRCFIVPHIVTTEEEGKAGDKLAKQNVKWWKEKQAA